MAQNLVSSLKEEYTFSEESYEKKYGPPHGWVGPEPAIGSQIFIGHIPYHINEDELIPLCKQFGRVFEFILKLNKGNREKNRGYAFVMYTNNEDASKAVQLLNGIEIRPGHQITASKSSDIRRIFISGLPEDKTKLEMEAELRRLTDGLTKLINVDFFPGCVFVEYKDKASAKIALRFLKSAIIFNRRINSKVAHPEALVADETNIQEPIAQDMGTDNYDPQLPGTSRSGSMPGASISVPRESYFPDTESLSSSTDEENNSPESKQVQADVIDVKEIPAVCSDENMKK